MTSLVSNSSPGQNSPDLAAEASFNKAHHRIRCYQRNVTVLPNESGQCAAAGCDESFSDVKKLEAHGSNKHKPFFCRCGKRLAHNRSLRRHIKNKTENKNFTCLDPQNEGCTKSYARYSNLQRHIKDKHNQAGPALDPGLDVFEDALNPADLLSSHLYLQSSSNLATLPSIEPISGLVAASRIQVAPGPAAAPDLGQHLGGNPSHPFPPSSQAFPQQQAPPQRQAFSHHAFHQQQAFSHQAAPQQAAVQHAVPQQVVSQHVISPQVLPQQQANFGLSQFTGHATSPVNSDPMQFSQGAPHWHSDPLFLLDSP